MFKESQDCMPELHPLPENSTQDSSAEDGATASTQGEPFSELHPQWTGFCWALPHQTRTSQEAHSGERLPGSICVPGYKGQVVSSQSTGALNATLKRFVSRRGKPSDIYSDHGSNFIGARHEFTNSSLFPLQTKKSPSVYSKDM